MNTLANWIANTIYVARGEKISFDGWRYMPGMIDTNHRRRLFKMSRQVGKSTIGSAESLARLTLLHNFDMLYVAPEQGQTNKFSKQKVGPMLASSPILKNQIATYNNVYEKSFQRGGTYFMGYAKHNPDSVRGITCDGVQYDEVQDIDFFEVQPIIDRAMFKSEHKMRIYSGTPKSFENDIEVLWQDSDQREWLIRCDHHSPGKWINVGFKNIGKHGPICHHCGNLLDVNDGQWVKHNKGADIAGFHVHQLHCKLSHRTQEDWDEILIAIDKEPEEKIRNEIFGVSADTSEVPITEPMLRNCCDEELNNDLAVDHMEAERYAGIDWGHGEAATALSIGQFYNGKFRYIFFKKYEGKQCDPDYAIPDILSILRRFRVARVHCDQGGGFGLNSRLAKEYGKRKVTANTWSDSAKSKDKNWSTKNVEIPRLTLNKTKAISNYIQLIHSRELQFVRWDVFYPRFAKDFLNVRKELDRKENVRYIKGGNDDLFQAAVYCYVIAKMSTHSLI